jgi:hypothetical protein
MKKQWVNPVDRAPKEATMNMEANFDEFTEIMKRIVTVPEKKEPTKPSSSPAPVVS